MPLLIANSKCVTILATGEMLVSLFVTFLLPADGANPQIFRIHQWSEQSSVEVLQFVGKQNT